MYPAGTTPEFTLNMHLNFVSPIVTQGRLQGPLRGCHLSAAYTILFHVTLSRPYLLESSDQTIRMTFAPSKEPHRANFDAAYPDKAVT